MSDQRTILVKALSGHVLDTRSQDSGSQCMCGSDSRFEQRHNGWVDPPWPTLAEHRADLVLHALQQQSTPAADQVLLVRDVLWATGALPSPEWIAMAERTGLHRAAAVLRYIADTPGEGTRPPPPEGHFDEALTRDDERILAAEHDEPREQARAAAGKHPHLERLRALSRAATPGPWEQGRYRDGEMLPDGTGSQDDYETLTGEIVAWGDEIPDGSGERYAAAEMDASRPQDAEFIIAAVAYVRRLLGEPGGQDDRPPIDERGRRPFAYVDKVTHEPCPVRRDNDGNVRLLCTLANTVPGHLHFDASLLDPVVDRQGDVWRLGLDGLMHTPETAPFPRAHVERKWGPLRPVDQPPVAP